MKMQKTFLSLLMINAIGLSINAATTINSNRFSYGPNIGWMDWHGDVANGAAIGEFVCSGFIYAANVGWINLGDGTPANRVRYQNNSSSDFGVNHDGAGNLSGFAYSANIGWLNFTNRDATGATFDGPRVDLRTGRLSGLIYGANIGWISLGNAVAFVQTDRLQRDPDSDADGMPDNWELQFSGSFATLNGTGDNDGDGLTNAQEYLADTNPLDPNSVLRITSFVANTGGNANTVAFTSRPSRLYEVQERATLNSGDPWSDTGLGLISPDVSGTTTRTFTDAPSPARFFRVEAVRPLSP